MDDRQQPWSAGEIGLPACGLRELCCRVASLRPYELARQTGVYRRDSRMAQVMTWRRDSPHEWQELLRLFAIQIPAPAQTGRTHYHWTHA